MLFSLEWIRSLCPFEQGAEEAARTLTARGLTVDSMQQAGEDTLLELDVPANRPDCLGHLGVARELAAAFGVPLLGRPAPTTREAGTAGTLVGVEIEDPALCPRYSARVVRQVRVGSSPEWVVRRLEACGLRSINNVVDASNLVLLELGNPIHFFDLQLVPQGRIIVRSARSGETLTTLDGVERSLLESDLVIADGSRPIALAGIMGGADTEIHQGTTQVLIEAASFRPGTVRATARRLGLHTDASHRFERGVDPEAVPAAQELAVRLLAELAAGEPVPGIVDLYPTPPERRPLRVRLERIRRLLGYQPSREEVRQALEPLGLAPRAVEDGAVFEIDPPSWRVDLEREADLVEEVARHLGYDRIPAASHSGTALRREPSRVALRLEERIRDRLACHGFHEAFCYAMIGENEDDPFVDEPAPPALALTNPIAEPMSRLRRSLVPGLLQAADRNLRRGIADVRLFEIGTAFVDRGEGRFPAEPSRLGLLWCGAASPAHWSAQERPVDLPDVAGLVEAVVSGLRPGEPPHRDAGGPPGIHPGRSLRWSLDSGTPLGWCGALHPRLRAEMDLPGGIYVAELDLAPLAPTAGEPVQHRPPPRFPAVQRDLSLLVNRGTAYRDVEQVLREVSPPAPVRLSVIDRYEGKPLGEDEVSITVRLSLEPTERTLTDEQIESYRRELVGLLAARLGIRLRG